MNETEVRARLSSLKTEADALSRSLAALLTDLDGEYVQVPRNGRWTRPTVTELWQNVRHLPGARGLFAATADQAGNAVPLVDVLTRSGLDRDQQRNEHARLSRTARELFGTKSWPIEAWQGAADGMFYRMDPTIALWWRHAQGANDAGQPE